MIEFNERAEFALSVPLGASFVAEGSYAGVYLFAGWRRNTVGCEAVFVRAYEQDPGFATARSPYEPWVYHASQTATLLRKFPALTSFLVADET